MPGQIEINGRQYEVKQLLATQTVMLQARLLKIVGPGMEELKVLLSGNIDEMMQAQVALAGMGKIFADCDPRAVTGFIKDVVESCRVKRRDSGQMGDVIMDADFSGKTNDLFKLLFFALKDMFGEFFTELQVAGRDALENTI